MGEVLYEDRSIQLDDGIAKWVTQWESVYAQPATEYRMPEGKVEVVVMHASGDLVLVGEDGRRFRVPDAEQVYERLRDVIGDRSK